ncbi:MAG: histidine phosphatase family protein [Vitreimonas sp.]
MFLIRHGEPEAAWGGDRGDPGLSSQGHEQAAMAAAALSREGALAVLSSPMRRCQETAAPYLRRVGLAAAATRLDFGEVAAPVGTADRRGWLMDNFPWRAGLPPRSWDAAAPELRAWRNAVLNAALAIREDTAVFTHFIASNVIVGAAMQSPHTIAFRPEYASITELDVRDGMIVLRHLGDEMGQGEVH